MSRIQQSFAALKANHRKGLIPYFCAGDPSPALTVPLMHALAQSGADVIELGIPFSDPMADGPLIQRAAERAIKHGVGLRDVFEMVREFRQTNLLTPVVLMGYANPIEHLGKEEFVRLAKETGVDGVLIVDYPPEECVDFVELLKAQGIDPIFLLAPTSTNERIAEVARHASGYLYYVSLKGITGAGHLDVSSVAAKLPLIQRFTQVPIAVGFGIKDAVTAQAVGQVADAVVVGSRIIQELENSSPDDAVFAVRRLISELRSALDEISIHPKEVA